MLTHGLLQTDSVRLIFGIYQNRAENRWFQHCVTVAALRAFWALVELLIDLIQEKILLGRWEVSAAEQVLAEAQSLGDLLRTSGGTFEWLATLSLLLS